MIAAIILFGLHRLLFESIHFGGLTKTSRVMLLGMVVFTFVPVLLLKGEVGLPETAVTSFTAKIAQNIRLSRAAKAEADRFDSRELAPFYQFTDAELRQKPDIYLIFLESYGSVCTSEMISAPRMKPLLETLNRSA